MSTSTVPSQLTDAELRLLQALVYQECGMHFDERRAHFLQDRLQRRLRECQLDSFYSYYRLLISTEGKNELARLLENLTVNETSFFRNKAQLDLFHKYISLRRGKWKFSPAISATRFCALPNRAFTANRKCHRWILAIAFAISTKSANATR